MRPVTVCPILSAQPLLPLLPCCQPRPDACVTQMNAPSSFPLSLRLFVSVRVGVCVSYVWHRLARAEDLGGLSDQVATAALRQAYQPLFKCIKSIVLPLLLSYIYTRIVNPLAFSTQLSEACCAYLHVSCFLSRRRRATDSNRLLDCSVRLLRHVTICLVDCLNSSSNR